MHRRPITRFDSSRILAEFSSTGPRGLGTRDSSHRHKGKSNAREVHHPHCSSAATRRRARPPPSTRCSSPSSPSPSSSVSTAFGGALSSYFSGLGSTVSGWAPTDRTHPEPAARECGRLLCFIVTRRGADAATSADLACHASGATSAERPPPSTASWSASSPSSIVGGVDRVRRRPRATCSAASRTAGRRRRSVTPTGQARRRRASAASHGITSSILKATGHRSPSVISTSRRQRR